MSYYCDELTTFRVKECDPPFLLEVKTKKNEKIELSFGKVSERHFIKAPIKAFYGVTVELENAEELREALRILNKKVINIYVDYRHLPFKKTCSFAVTDFRLWLRDNIKEGWYYVIHKYSDLGVEIRYEEDYEIKTYVAPNDVFDLSATWDEYFTVEVSDGCLPPKYEKRIFAEMLKNREKESRLFYAVDMNDIKERLGIPERYGFEIAGFEKIVIG